MYLYIQTLGLLHHTEDIDLVQGILKICTEKVTSAWASLMVVCLPSVCFALGLSLALRKEKKKKAYVGKPNFEVLEMKPRALCS